MAVKSRVSFCVFLLVSRDQRAFAVRVVAELCCINGDSGRNHHCLTVFVRGFVVKSGDWRESAYWICTFSNSQWHVQAELGNGRCDLNHWRSSLNLWGNGFNRKLRCRHISILDWFQLTWICSHGGHFLLIRWQDSSFYLALNSPECRGTAMIIDEQVLPLQRVWCLFEVYQTIHLSRIRRARAAQTERFFLVWLGFPVFLFGAVAMDASRKNGICSFKKPTTEVQTVNFRVCFYALPPGCCKRAERAQMLPLLWPNKSRIWILAVQKPQVRMTGSWFIPSLSKCLEVLIGWTLSSEKQFDLHWKILTSTTKMHSHI